MKTKLCVNALINDKLITITKEEKQKIVKYLLTQYTERQLEEITGIPRSTLHDWKTLRQKNKGESIHVSLSLIYRRLSNLNPKKIVDWGRIEQIKEKCEELLLKRKC